MKSTSNRLWQFPLAAKAALRRSTKFHTVYLSRQKAAWQQLIDVSDDARQKMFDNVKREFIQENGISNGDTTKRSKIFREYQLSVKKEDRAKGTWTLQQYEGKYRSAMYAAVKAANPKWEPGQPFDPRSKASCRERV